MNKPTRSLVGIPIFNEDQYLNQTLNSLEPILDAIPTLDLLLYDDGSTDATPLIIQDAKDKWGADRILLAHHQVSKGYGQTITDILRFGCQNQTNYDFVITFDADLQHDPGTIPRILDTMNDDSVDVVSSSRYLDSQLVFQGVQESPVPYDRYLINMTLTHLTNALYNFNLTDSFCGLKGYRTCKIEKIFAMRDVGYSSPIEFWTNLAYHDIMSVVEVPTPLIYIKDRRGRGNWRKRFNNFISAFQQYSWADTQQHYLLTIKPKIEKFIESCLLEEQQSNNIASNYILEYNEFWNRLADSQWNPFSPKNTQRMKIQINSNNLS